MEQAIEKLSNLIKVIEQRIPDENDLKGFPGISRSLILGSLTECNGLLNALKGHNNHFEVILLKRELAELFEELFNALDENFDKIKGDKFNTILKQILKLRAVIREAYIAVINAVPIRTEADIAKTKDELILLSSNNEELKRIHQELLILKDETIQNIAVVTTEATTLKDSISGIKDELEEMKVTSSTIVIDFQEKQRVATENENKIATFIATIEETKSVVEGIKENTTQWQSDIKVAKENFETRVDEFEKLNRKSKDVQKEIEDTHEKIFGKKDEEGKQLKGYLQETEDLKKEMAEFLEAQEKKFIAQYDEVKSLLPDATSAGLAAAYQQQKESYTKPIQLWSIVFFGTIAIMTSLGVFILYKHFKATTESSLNDALISLLKDLPFFIPTIWLAAFASKQQSQYKRLQQEYAFKETNAKSFHGHKEQIERLMKDSGADKELLSQLVAQLVIITAQNPSNTLDNKSHEDSPPIFKLAEKYFPEIGKKGGKV
jgi:DNA repair exonuclease SbcCD ATPase subunit